VSPSTDSSLSDVELRPIDLFNLRDVLRLQVTEQQSNFVASVPDSLAEAETNPDAHPWYRAVHADGLPVGFVMISDGIPPGNPELVGPYYLWRLLIDADHQGRGYGTRVLDLVCDYVRIRPGGDTLLTSVVPDDGGPMPFYRKYGFVLTGEVVDDEPLLRLDL
jgi:diamine N-acetyltransferase